MAKVLHQTLSNHYVSRDRHLVQMASDDDKEELLLCCRYGELDEVQRFVGKYGAEVLEDVRDDNGNTALHMACGNGHEDILDYILPLVSPSLVAIANQAGSTPLHWAALNSHFSIVKKLVLFPQGPGAALIDIKNTAGRSPLGEAEFSGWEEGAQWLVGQMNLDDGAGAAVGKEEEVDGNELEPEMGDCEVEIQDAEGGVAKMNLGQAKAR